MKYANVSFGELGIAPQLLNILERLKFTQPTAIQHETIPAAIQGEDIVGIAQTGTGKTLAFAVPIIQRLQQIPGQALVLVPTRELAVQIEDTFARVGQEFKIRTATLIGGDSMNAQLKAILRKPSVIIATPGRLIDHLQRKNLVLSGVCILVLDEADRMLDMGFEPQLKMIFQYVPKQRQTMLFSATMPKEILEVASSYMKRPTHIEVAPSGTMAESITQELFILKKEMKTKTLIKLLHQYQGSVLIFARTKFGTRRLAAEINASGHRAAEIHSDRTLAQRREALEGFKRGKYRILVATDIAARGIDVDNIQFVINYDLPQKAEDYVHRIGRTGRIGRSGHAVSFATPDQKNDVRNIEMVLKTAIPMAQHPEIALEHFVQGGVQSFRRDRRPGYKSSRRTTRRPADKKFSPFYSNFSSFGKK